MKTILQNKGNQRWFKATRHMNRDKRKPKAGFTVNVWWRIGEKSYGAGFYVGRFHPTPPAHFEAEGYRQGVAYRIRVYPK